jgi:hypothetical protein
VTRTVGRTDDQQPHSLGASRKLVQQLGLKDCGNAQAADSQRIDRRRIVEGRQREERKVGRERSRQLGAISGQPRAQPDECHAVSIDGMAAP